MNRMQRICAWPGCHELTSGTYCPAHEAQLPKREDRRENASERGYDTQWKKFREIYLRRPENQFCSLHISKRCRIRADCIDHIVPLELGGAKYAEDNLQPACTPCNVLKGRKILKGSWVYGRDPM